MLKLITQVVQDKDSRSGRVFEYVVQFLIVVSLISFSIETLPDLSENLRSFLNVIEIITVVFFTIEYILRLSTAKNPMKYALSFYGVVDLIAVVPFYIQSGIDLRSIRVLRLFRLVRIFKLVRYNRAIQRFHKALVIAKEEIILFLFVTALLIYLASVGIYFFENPAQPEVFKSVFHSLWWAVSTLTTVGYGDVYPITVGGKIFTFFILIIGLGIVAVPAGLVSSALSIARDMEENDEIQTS